MANFLDGSGVFFENEQVELLIATRSSHRRTLIGELIVESFEVSTLISRVFNPIETENDHVDLSDDHWQNRDGWDPMNPNNDFLIGELIEEWKSKAAAMSQWNRFISCVDPACPCNLDNIGMAIEEIDKPTMVETPILSRKVNGTTELTKTSETPGTSSGFSEIFSESSASSGNFENYHYLGEEWLVVDSHDCCWNTCIMTDEMVMSLTPWRPYLCYRQFP